MTSRRPVRFGVIGCGVIAYWTHLRELKRLQGATLVAAADPDAAARDRAARLTGVPVYERVDHLLDRSDIDAVVICAPTHLHAELTVAACVAGKHVYVEKPIATTAEDARRICEAAAAAHRLIAVGFNRRCHPAFQQARELIAAGRIGRVRAALTAFTEPSAANEMPPWKRRRSTGGGVLFDLASHHIDLLRWFLDDEVAQVEARLASEATETDTAWLQIAMRGGAEARCFFSFRTGRADFLEFIGDKGTLRVDRHRPTLSLRLARRAGYGVRNAVVLPTGSMIAWRLVRLVRPSYESSYRRALDAFVGSINGEPARGATLSDGVKCLDVILAAEGSTPEIAPMMAANSRG
jgi:predicted dehydrogenase